MSGGDRQGRPAARRPHRDGPPGPRRAQRRGRAAARAALRRRRPALPDRLRQRQRPAARARPAAPAGVRDARRDRRRPGPAVPARADRGGRGRDDGGACSAPASPTASSRCCSAIGGHAVPRADAVAVGWPVLLFGALAALVAGVVAGLLPALRASWGDRFTLLKGSRTTAGRAERRLLAGVAAVQVVLTVVAARRRGAADAHGAEPRSRASGLRHRAHPGDDGHARRRPRSGPRLPRSGARARRRDRRRPPRRLRLGRAAHRQQLAGRDRGGRPRRGVVGDRRSHQPAAAVGDRGLLRGDGHAARSRAGCSCRPTTATRRGSGSSTRRSCAVTSAAAPAIGRQLRFPGNDKPLTIVGVHRRHAHRAAARARRSPSCTCRSGRTARSRSTSSCAPPAIRWRWRRRSARRCAPSSRRSPSSTSRRWPRSAARRPRRRRSRCACWPASRWSRRCSPRSGSTACCRCRWARGRRSWRCARRSARAGTR